MHGKKIIKIHEKEIKKYRDEYYKNIIFNSKNTTYSNPVLVFIVPLTISLITLLLCRCTIIGYIISIVELIIINLLIYLLYTSRIERNKYLEIIKKYGYTSIEDYEKKLKEYITGPNGYYNNLLLELIEKYNINSSTKRIQTIKGEEYYIWSNKSKDKIYLLNTRCNKKPEIKIIQISDIRYYRSDSQNKSVLLKTNNDIFNFKEEYITIFNEMIKGKRLEDLKKFEPGTYIDDFEIYMHKVKKSLQADNTKKREQYETSIQNSIYTLLAIILLIIISTILPKISSITNIINIILIILLNISINGILNNIVKKNIKKDKEVIQEINCDPDCVERFNELKYALGIKNTYDKVYTKEGAEYLTWVANGYFHVFLNLIYFNSVYMSVKTSDIKFYKTDYNSCEIKLKDKTLEFTKEAANIFSKILPNKDYDWIKKMQNK